MNALYVATIQIVVPVEGNDTEAGRQAEAQDYIAETLRGLFTDWAYSRIGKQYQYPTRLELRSDMYQEGDFLRT